LSPKETVLPVTYLTDNTDEVLSRASDTGQAVLLTEEGEAKVVVLDVETYYRWKDYLESRLAAGSRPPPIFTKAEAQEEAYRLADDAARRAAGMKP
jgi:prevent-host-death family protein